MRKLRGYLIKLLAGKSIVAINVTTVQYKDTK